MNATYNRSMDYKVYEAVPSYAHSFSPGGHGNVAAREFLYPKATPFNDMARDVRAENEHFWTDLVTGLPLVDRNKGEMFALMHSELSEALEAERKDLMDDHLPHRKGVEVELADLFIRAMDYAGEYDLDLDGAIAEKREYNRKRKDHTREARLGPNGKKW